MTCDENGGKDDKKGVAMATMNAEIKVLVGEKVVVDSVNGLVPDGQGWHATVPEEGATAELRVLGADQASHEAIVRVRSISEVDGKVVDWASEPQTGAYFYSPPLAHGATLRIELDDASGPKPVPNGGGHFRVLDPGGGE